MRLISCLSTRKDAAAAYLLPSLVLARPREDSIHVTRQDGYEIN